MTKHILSILLLGLAAVLPFEANAHEALAAPAVAGTTAEVNEDVKLEVNGRNVRVVGADGKTLEVYNLTGQRVATFRIDAAEKVVKLDVARGPYILRVGKATRKVYFN